MPTIAKQKQIEADTKTKQLTKEEKSFIDKIMTEFINAYRKKNINTLTNLMVRRWTGHVDEDIINDKVQDLYIWMYTHYDVTVSFYNQHGQIKGLQKLMNLLLYNIRNISDVKKKLLNSVHFEPFDNTMLEIPDEEEQQFTLDSLNPHLPTEKRLEAHLIALEETKQWLLDNPESYAAKALRMLREDSQYIKKPKNIQLTDKGEEYYKVALHYIATPSMSFIYSNAQELGIIKSHQPIIHFKRIFASLYGKEPVKHIEYKWKDLK